MTFDTWEFWLIAIPLILLLAGMFTLTQHYEEHSKETKRDLDEIRLSLMRIENLLKERK